MSAKVIACAVKVDVLMAKPVNGIPPIAPPKLVAPLAMVDKLKAPSTVEAKLILVPVKVVVAPKVTASL